MPGEIHREIDILRNVNFGVKIVADVWSSFIKVIQASLLPEQSYGDDRPAEENDFVTFKTQVGLGLDALNNFINKFVAHSSNDSFDRDSLVWLLILCGEHSSVELWTSDDSRRFSTLCVGTLCTFQGCTSLSQLLLGLCGKSPNPCFKQALLLLRPKLLRDTWRKHPAAIITYKWFLIQVRSPHLSQYLDIISPTALLLLDDHDDDRKLIGLLCLSHIIDNVARTEMYQRGIDKVFYKTLEPLLWQRQAKLIQPAVTCLTKLLSLTERGYTRRVEPGMWDLFDDTLSTLLDKMVFEDQIPLRMAYIQCVGPLLSEMGPSVIRWSKPLLAMFDEYLCKESFDTRKYALQALKVYLNLAVVRLEENGDEILFLLLRTLTDVCHHIESLKSGSVNDLVENLRELIFLVGKVCPQNFNMVVSELENENCSTLFKTIVQECRHQNPRPAIL